MGSGLGDFVRGKATGLATLLALLGGPFSPAHAFQISPVGPKLEARLTNETPGRLAKVAGQLGILLKGPVHEEITHLGAGCPADVRNLRDDEDCADVDAGYADPFVIYGVRWNDVPPFRLDADEGNCPVIGARCKTDQTIRFSTQPACWYCLFSDAAKVAKTHRITQCTRPRGFRKGNLMTRSHFGDLQFLHAMADAEQIPATVTRDELLGWAEFTWKVALGEIKHDARLSDIEIPAIDEHFGCQGWSVADLYILGRQEPAQKLLPKLDRIAFGSLLHTVQDSFAAGHVDREGETSTVACGGTGFTRPPRILEFHNYGAQDGTKHDDDDERMAMALKEAKGPLPHAVEATRNLFTLLNRRAPWSEARTYLECVFELAPGHRSSSPGSRYRLPG